MGAPQFWLGVAACTALVLVSVAPSALHPRRTVEVYKVFDRAPAPVRDPFYKPGPLAHPAIPPHATPRARGSAPHRTGRTPAREREAITESRKRAVWHPHPDDELPPWKLLR